MSSFNISHPQLLRSLMDGQPVLLHTNLVADLETPVSAYLKLAVGEDYACLLESVEGGEQRGRYSLIGLRPDRLWILEDSQITLKHLEQKGHLANWFEIAETKPVFESLRHFIADSAIALPKELPPMAAGIIGHMGYELVHDMEAVGALKTDDLKLPKALLFRPQVMAIFDMIANRITLAVPVRPIDGQKTDEKSAEKALASAQSLIDEMLVRLHEPLAIERQNDKKPAALPLYDIVPSMSKSDYLHMVKRAKDYIAAGDIFQIVLSQRFSMPFSLPPFALYRALRRTNPSPFLYFLHMKDFDIVGSSPEILVRLRDKKVTIRPIAGTRPRGRDRAEDLALERDLLADPKEYSEHLMLLDLGRNDTGRVCKPGSVQVSDRFFIERYSHVMHIVSNVVGEIRDGADAVDALIAGFPAGTVSGAPKVRAMQLINAMEPSARGVYAGSVGYFSADGSMDSCIVLRTAIVRDGMIHVQAGAGIVADSDPESEYQECLNKAMALFKAAEEAHKMAS